LGFTWQAIKPEKIGGLSRSLKPNCEGSIYLQKKRSLFRKGFLKNWQIFANQKLQLRTYIFTGSVFLLRIRAEISSSILLFLLLVD